MNREFQVRVQAEPEIAALLMTEKKYELTLPEGENFQGALWLRAEDDRQLAGVVTANNHRILIAKSAFEGTECKIVFGLDTNGLQAGEKIEGSMMVISNLGEVRIPVHVEIVERMISEKGDQVSNLQDFTKVCKDSFAEGFRMFRNPCFIDILQGKDAQYRALYKGLSAMPVTHQYMEEFLVATEMKKQITLRFDKESMVYDTLTGNERDTLYVYRNTWGYVHMDIEVTGDFLEISRKSVSSEEFIGKVFALDYVILYNRLKPWKKTATIKVRTMHQELVYTITASAGEATLKARDIRAHREQSRLMRLLLQYKLGQMEEATWYIKSKNDLEELCISYPNEAKYVLYKAFMDMERGKTADAMQVIWPIKDGTLRMHYQEEKAVYRYIAKNIGLLPDEDNNILPELQALSAKLPSNVLLLYMIHREEEKKNPPDEMRYLRQLEFCYETGCNSPILYLYAWVLLRKNEANLRKLSPFYLAVLSFAMKNGAITEKALRRCAFLSDNVKRFSGNLYRILCDGYAKYRSDDILEAICRLVIKGNAAKPAYFDWYELAVQKNLRITRIYEYYMETHPRKAEEALPMSVLMYFAYNDTLSERVKAFLFASVIKHKDSDPGVYEMYYPKMRTFAEMALEKGEMDENYAVLYEECYHIPLSGRVAALMAGVIFRCKLTVADPRVRNVILVYDAMQKETVYPVSGGVAYVDMYGRGAGVLFEDEHHRRFTDVEWHVQKLMEPGETAEVCAHFHVQYAGLLIYCCGDTISDIQISEENISSYILLLEDADFAEDYKKEVRRRLMLYYIDKTPSKERTAFVYSMNVPLFVEADKSNCVTLLIREGRYVEAFAALSEYGYEHIDPTLMLQMTREIIAQTDAAYDEELLAMSVFVVRSGKYDETVLAYMRSYYDGPVSDLCALRKMLLGFGMETYAVEEKILKQCVFAHTFPQQEVQVLEAYMKAQGNIQVISQYLAYICRQELMGRRKIQKQVHELIESCYSRQWNLSISTQISLLRYYAKLSAVKQNVPADKELTEMQLQNSSRLLETLMGKNIRFGFYQELPLKLIEKYQLEDKLFIEERFLPGTQVKICYRIERSADEAAGGENWQTEQLQDVYRGIFVKELLLFYGEKVTYHLEITEKGESRRTEDKTLLPSQRVSTGRSRFSLLNRMLKLKDEQDAEGLRQAAAQYLQQEAFVDSFLQLM